MNNEAEYRNYSKGAALKNLVSVLLNGDDCAHAVMLWGDVVFRFWLRDYICDIAGKLMQREPISQTAHQQYTMASGNQMLARRERVAKDDFFDLSGLFKRDAITLELSFWESAEVFGKIANARQKQQRDLWTTTGKQVEKPLMMVLCRLFQVPEKHFDQSQVPQSLREVDFFLIDKAGEFKRCEVKLMGKGNPESADAVEARDTDVFVADTLSEKARGWLSDDKSRGRSIQWVELRSDQGFRKFGEVLKVFKIPYKPVEGDFSEVLERVLAEMPDEVVEKMAQEIENPIAEAK